MKSIVIVIIKSIVMFFYNVINVYSLDY